MMRAMCSSSWPRFSPQSPVEHGLVVRLEEDLSCGQLEGQAGGAPDVSRRVVLGPQQNLYGPVHPGLDDLVPESFKCVDSQTHVSYLD